MSDETIDTINKGISLSLFLVAVVLWMVFLGDYVTNIILSAIWFFPSALFIYDLIRFATDRKEEFRTIQRKCDISRPALHVLALFWSIVTILISKYHHEIGFFESNVGIWCIVAMVFVFLNVILINGFIIVRRQPQNNVDKPQVIDEELPEEGRVLLDTLEWYTKLAEENNGENSKLMALSIPTFNVQQYNGDAPFVEYCNELSSIPKTYPELASLEQFALMVADNSGVDEMLDTIAKNMGYLAKDGLEWAGGLKDVLAKTTSSVVDYFHHPDGETTQHLLDNIRDTIDKDVHRAFFRMGFSHANGVSGKLGYLTKHLFQDAGKGTAETFFDFDDLHEMNDHFVDSLHEHIDDVVSSLPTDVEMDIWDPNFDGSAHFPIITTAIEAIKLGEKYSDGDVDMEKAFEKSVTKIGFTAGGAGIGSLIGAGLGTLIFPGAGTGVGAKVGAIVGSLIGKNEAKEINMADLKKLQEEFDEQKRILDKRVNDAEKNIERYRRETNTSVESISKTESRRFEELKSENPMTLVNGEMMSRSYTLVVRDYLLDFLNSNESSISEKERREVNRYIPTVEQCKYYPQESLRLMLSAKEVVNRNANGSYFCDFNDIYEICISNIVEDVVIAKTSQALWYNHLRNSYKSSIFNILQMSNDSIKGYVENVNDEYRRIDVEVDKLKEIKQKVEKEAKTL